MKRKAGADSKAQASGSKVPPNPAGIDYRKHPELYKVAKGEQGVLTVEPYKSEILPHWRFRLGACISHIFELAKARSLITYGPVTALTVEHLK